MRPPYRLFISHTGTDRALAEAIRALLNNAFEGTVRAFLAAADLSPGDDWQDRIRGALAESDALVSILTPESVSQPWIYVEWCAFWREDRTYYTLLHELSPGQMFEPMRARQAIELADIKQMKRLLSAVADAAKVRVVPYHALDTWTTEYASALAEREHILFGRYMDPAADLSRLSDERRAQIASYAARLGFIDRLFPLAEAIDDDDKRRDFARELITRGNLTAAGIVINALDSGTALRKVAQHMVRHGLDGTPLFAELLMKLHKESDTSLHKLLMSVPSARADLVERVVLSITHPPSVRDALNYLVDTGRVDLPCFHAAVERISDRGRPELRKVAQHMLSVGCLDIPALVKVLAGLRGNQREYDFIMKELERLHPELLPEISARLGMSEHA